MAEIARTGLPVAVKKRLVGYRLGRSRRRNRRQSAEDVFTEIYEKGQWASGSDGPFDSGIGSSGYPAEAYVEWVRSLIRQSESRVVVDVGCGDFRVASRFARGADLYTGTDIVGGLVAHNQEVFGGERIRFLHLDASRTRLPDGDICLVRQVLQHLSNDEIQSILSNVQHIP